MQVCLVSTDEKMQGLVRELVGPTLRIATPGEEPPAAELYLWDFQSGVGPHASDSLGKRHIFLVDRRDLPTFGEQIGIDAVLVVLKPVNPGTLQAFIQLCQNVGACFPGEDLNALRLDRDSLLQYALQANLKLQEHDQDRTNFLARALHDLRAPLTAVQGYCGLLLESQLGPLNTQQSDLLQRMQNSSRRMARLAGGMFELSVQGRVQRKLQLERAEIEECVDQALHELSPLLNDKKIVVSAQLDPPDQLMLMEPEQIQQVLINLLENACKFTPKGGDIEIRGYPVLWDSSAPEQVESGPASNAYCIEVRDSGPGVEPGVMETIFEQYTRYSGGSDRSGSGLGLAICKLIVGAHGGRIWARACEEGAVFSFVLPFEAGVGSLTRHGVSSESAQPRVSRAV
jgi:signal transduction histidine kinase